MKITFEDVKGDVETWSSNLLSEIAAVKKARSAVELFQAIEDAEYCMRKLSEVVESIEEEGGLPR